MFSGGGGQRLSQGDGAEYGMQVNAYFCNKLSSPYDEIEFVSVPIKMHNANGTVAFSSDCVTVPATWSVTAAQILARKYCRKSGVPAALKRVAEDGVPEWLWRSEPDREKLSRMPDEARYGSETDARNVFNRLAGTWTYWGWKGGYFDTEADAANFYAEMIRLLALQMFSPNSPQWYSTGLHWAYGIRSSADGYHIISDNGEPAPAETSDSHAFLHSCFIQAINDDLIGDNGVMDLITVEARIAKSGAGTGANFSALRGYEETLSAGGHASGLLAALKASDKAATLVTARGSTRRSSKMVLVDADHPEIEDFVEWKVHEEHKVASLVCGSVNCNQKLKAIYQTCNAAAAQSQARTEAEFRQAVDDARLHKIPENAIVNTIELARSGGGWQDFLNFNTHWDSDAYLSVSGQNSNNSVKVTNEFMDAVERDTDWQLINRKNGTVARAISARALWDKISYAAWASADPGLQYDATINEWHTCPITQRINGSNSCSEFMFLDQTATTLASINLRPFAADGEVDIAAFSQTARLVSLMLEISVSRAIYPSREIAEKTYAFRPLGLGFTNLGGMLMAAGIAYDSDEGREICAAISALMSGLAYATSAEIAADIGAFEGYRANKDAMLRVIRNHRRAAFGFKQGYEELTIMPVPLTGRSCPQPALVAAARAAWDEALSLGERHGYRNAQATMIAPTGTISLIMDCDTLGIEPDFALVKYKTLAAGGHVKIVNQVLVDALKRLGYDAGRINMIKDYILGTPRLKHAPCINRESLQAKGFTDQMIGNAERAIAQATDLRVALSPHNLGITFCERAFGLSADDLGDDGFDLLSYLGFEAAEIDRANIYCCGHQTAEGAPGLSPRHYEIFDCAVSGGAAGTRSLSSVSHLKMMAAAQPYISGGISKTVNLPRSASIDECRQVFQAAHKLCLKSVALYRDGSKLSQPLNAAQPAGANFKHVEPDDFLGQAEQLVYAKLDTATQLPAHIDLLVGAVAVGLKSGAAIDDFSSLFEAAAAANLDVQLMADATG